MHQELDADGLAYPRRKVYCLVDPTFVIRTLMVDGKESVTLSIGDIRILPIERNVIIGAIPMPEA